MYLICISFSLDVYCITPMEFYLTSFYVTALCIKLSHPILYSKEYKKSSQERGESIGKNCSQFP